MKPDYAMIILMAIITINDSKPKWHDILETGWSICLQRGQL